MVIFIEFARDGRCCVIGRKWVRSVGNIAVSFIIVLSLVDVSDRS